VDLKVSQRHRRRIGTGGSPIALILDDVVTTGTTLKSMASCLSDVGIEALGALTLAATPPPE
jgi:predicted amidophosphoribosyltransferase